MWKCTLSVFVILLAFTECRNSGEPSAPIQTNAGLGGQLYANAGPGFQPINTVATVVVLASDTTTEVTQVQSDTAGVFKVSLPVGEYFLYVKQSYSRYVTGPFLVQTGSYTVAKAYLYDPRVV